MTTTINQKLLEQYSKITSLSRLKGGGKDTTKIDSNIEFAKLAELLATYKNETDQ